MNLDSYFERIGYRSTPRADIGTLRELHLKHPCTIPFENLSTLLGEAVPLTIEALDDKLVRRRRGGYCFEQNTLFAYVLTAIGFEVTPLAARVVWNPAYLNPRTHMALLVELAGQRWLCDVGFGGATQTAPLALTVDAEQLTPHEKFRLAAIGAEFELQIQLQDQWRPVYRFDLQPQQPIDFEAMNFYVTTHPDSHFLRVLIAGRADSSGRFALSGNLLVRYESGIAVAEEPIRSPDRLKSVLANEFQITLPKHAALDSLLTSITSPPDM